MYSIIILVDHKILLLIVNQIRIPRFVLVYTSKQYPYTKLKEEMDYVTLHNLTDSLELNNILFEDLPEVNSLLIDDQ